MITTTSSYVNSNGLQSMAMGQVLPCYVEGGAFWLSSKEGAGGSSGLKL